MAAIALALAASLSWGLSDFLAGLKSRRLSVLTVLAISQPAGLLVIAAVLAARGVGPPGRDAILLAAIGGGTGALGLAAFYRGLAVGAMSIVAPISGLAAVLPIAVGLAQGERPSGLQGLGVAVALAGVALASREAEEEARQSRRVAEGLGFALVAAAGFGLFFVFIDAASERGGDVFWVTFTLRAASAGVVLAAAAAIRPTLPRDPRELPPLLAVGALDMAANLGFAAASTRGYVSVVSVLASLYPVVVVFLARVVLAERIARAQQVGVVLALAGVALITVG